MTTGSAAIGTLTPGSGEIGRLARTGNIPLGYYNDPERSAQVFFEHEGKREQLGPGGFNYIPAKMQHQAWTSEGSVVFITVDGAWDVNWVGNPPSKTDLGQTSPPGPK